MGEAWSGGAGAVAGEDEEVLCDRASSKNGILELHPPRVQVLRQFEDRTNFQLDFAFFEPFMLP